MILTARHPELDNERSYLASGVLALTTSTPLKSAVGIEIGDYVVMGYPGREKTEIVLITGKASNTIQHAALQFSHNIDTPITIIKYNKVRFYECETENGDYTLIATLDIDIDDLETRYEYNAGIPTNYYRADYLNVESGIYSELSDPLIGSGYTSASVAKMIEAVRVLVGQVPSDDEIIAMLNLAEAAVYDYRDKWYFAKERKVYTLEAETGRYPLPADFKMSSREVYHIKNATTLVQLDRRDYNAYMTDFYLATPSDDLGIWTIDEATEEVVFNPTPVLGVGTVEFGYWAGPSILKEYTDITKVPSTRFHVFFAASKIEASKKNTDQSKLYWNESQDALRSLGNKRYSGNQSFGVA